jgi:Holliday junction resolvase RusA-like endonuclease
MTTIDLAMPPSVNSIWRINRFRNKPYLSERYKTWKRDSDNRYLANKKTWLPVKGHFSARITLDEKRRRNSDADNRIKCLLDFLQRVGLIENDKLCDSLTVTWGWAPEGCRVLLQEHQATARAA